MRVGNAGSGSGSHGGGAGRERDRGAAFRRRHRVGERLSGRVLVREAPGLAWVDFQGLELLATIQSDPEPGSVLLFQIIRLEPDILLQELHVARAAGDPLGPAVDTFWAARSHFEARAGDLRRALAALPGGPDARAAAFRASLESDADLGAAFAAVDAAREAVSALLPLRGAGRLDYRPWLVPEALSMEIIERTVPRSGGGSLDETALSCTLPQAGQCELRLLESSGGASARLFTEHPEAAGAALDLLRAAGFPGPAVELFDPAPLPPTARAGLLAQLLATGPGGPPRFSRQV